MKTLQQSRSLWEKGFTEVSHIGDSMTVLVVLKKDDRYFCHRYVNMMDLDGDRWDCSVDLRDVTADECIVWLVRILTIRAGVLL